MCDLKVFNVYNVTWWQAINTFFQKTYGFIQSIVTDDSKTVTNHSPNFNTTLSLLANYIGDILIERINSAHMLNTNMKIKHIILQGKKKT